MAPEVSVVLVVVDEEGCFETPRAEESAAKEPPEEMDSPARESEVTVPGFSVLVGAEGSDVTLRGVLVG